ncbi:hypothetical protein BV25DRAFT_1934416 [Artomyces pyxidatus]|uniref:Uncharacterized protein n=1 Tax=Artomyces pyxidatus TaxID=48021 RepID=A0ACB8SF63_9AGAM|nr:hypothetical protein BV25DRAFT_1934416 [Artomyces pyxidatus]
MDTFNCNGWLHITVSDTTSEIFIKLRHEEAHTHYWPIDVPAEIVQYVRENANLPLQTIWLEILRKQGNKPTFSRKAIYQLWTKISSQKWKRDDDEVTSVMILLREPAIGPGAFRVDPVKLKPEPGLVAFGFLLPDMLEKWARRIRKISMDSAWNTNGSRFEVYAILGETYGSGMPLGFLMIQAHPDSTPGAKERLLRQLMAQLRDDWNIDPAFTLSDKDWSEINAFRAEFPNAKHQLCFWHALRAIKKRIAILRRGPGHYDGDAAHRAYHWIDAKWVPRGQSDQPTVFFRL